MNDFWSMNKYFSITIITSAIIVGIAYAYTHQPINVDRLLNQGYIECLESSLGTVEKGWTVKEACGAYARSMGK